MMAPVKLPMVTKSPLSPAPIERTTAGNKIIKTVHRYVFFCISAIDVIHDDFSRVLYVDGIGKVFSCILHVDGVRNVTRRLKIVNAKKDLERVVSRK